MDTIDLEVARRPDGIFDIVVRIGEGEPDQLRPCGQMECSADMWEALKDRLATARVRESKLSIRWRFA